MLDGDRALKSLFKKLYPHIPVWDFEKFISSYKRKSTNSSKSNTNVFDTPPPTHELFGKELKLVREIGDIEFLVPGGFLSFLTYKDFPEQFEFELFAIDANHLQSKHCSNQEALRACLFISKHHCVSKEGGKSSWVLTIKCPPAGKKLNSFEALKDEFGSVSDPVAVSIRTRISSTKKMCDRSSLFLICSSIDQVDLSICKQFRAVIPPHIYPYPVLDPSA